MCDPLYLHTGQVDCVKSVSCRYIEDGMTKAAYPGELYNDGCNKCLCGDTGIGACTKMMCPRKCYYDNWDGVSGWVAIGTDIVHVFDEGARCNKLCQCVEGNMGIARIKCNAGTRDCILN